MNSRKRTGPSNYDQDYPHKHQLPSPDSPDGRTSLPTSRYNSYTDHGVPTGPARSSYSGGSYRPSYRRDGNWRPINSTGRSSSAHSTTTRTVNAGGKSPVYNTMSPVAFHGEATPSGNNCSTPVQNTAPPVTPMATTGATLNTAIQPVNPAMIPANWMKIISGAYNAGCAEDYQKRLQKNGVPTTSVDIASLKRSRERKAQIAQDQFQNYKAPLQQFLSTGKITSDITNACSNGSAPPENARLTSIDGKLTIMELEIENLKKKNEILVEQLKEATEARKLSEHQMYVLIEEQACTAGQNFTSLLSERVPEIVQHAQKAATAWAEQNMQAIVNSQIAEQMTDLNKNVTTNTSQLEVIQEHLRHFDAFKVRVEADNLPALSDCSSKLETLEKQLSKLEPLEQRLLKVEGVEASAYDTTQNINDELKSVKRDQDALESYCKENVSKLESGIESASKATGLFDDKFKSVLEAVAALAPEANQTVAEVQAAITQLEAKVKILEQSVGTQHEVVQIAEKLEARVKELEQSALNASPPHCTQDEIAQATQRFERGLNEVQINLSKSNEDLGLLNNALAQAEDGLLNAKIDIETLKEQAPRLVDGYLSKTATRSEEFEKGLNNLANTIAELSRKVFTLEQHPVEAPLTSSHPVVTALSQRVDETIKTLDQLHGSRLDSINVDLQKQQRIINDGLDVNLQAIKDLDFRYQQISTDQLYQNIMHWVTENYRDVPGLTSQLGTVQASITDIKTRLSTVETWSDVVEGVRHAWQSIIEANNAMIQVQSESKEYQSSIVKVEAALSDLNKDCVHRSDLQSTCEAIQQQIKHERSESVARDVALEKRIDPLEKNVNKVESAIGQVDEVLGFKGDIMKACGRFPFQEARIGNIESMIRDLNANSDNPLSGMNFDLQPDA